MTLYLLFERLEAGKIRLDSQLKVSEHASEQAPTKLGLRPGQTIVVDDAIKAVVTKSANDAAVTIAENIAGDEAEFARLMTQKARALGMSRTTYVNASGLPDDDQITTARDQALLGRAIQERFPRYYRYFSTPEFVYHGREMRNHNHLLGEVGGVDGIKTGYTRASGFNLVTSVHRDGRYLVAVVLGGRSASERDERMRELIGDHIREATLRHIAPPVAEKSEPRAEPQPRRLRSAQTPLPPQGRNDEQRHDELPNRQRGPATQSSRSWSGRLPTAPLPAQTDSFAADACACPGRRSVTAVAVAPVAVRTAAGGAARAGTKPHRRRVDRARSDRHHRQSGTGQDQSPDPRARQSTTRTRAANG